MNEDDITINAPTFDTEVEMNLGTWEDETSVLPEEIGSAYPQEFDEESARIQKQLALASVWLYDDDEEAKKRVDENADTRMYALPSMRTVNTSWLWGKEFARGADPKYADLPMDLVKRAIEDSTETNLKDSYYEDYNRLVEQGSANANDYYSLYARVKKDAIRGDYERAKVRQEKAKELSAQAQQIIASRLMGDASVDLSGIEADDDGKEIVARIFANPENRKAFDRASATMKSIRDFVAKEGDVFGFEAENPDVSDLLYLRNMITDSVLNEDGTVDEKTMAWLKQGIKGYALMLKQKDPDAFGRFYISMSSMFSNIKHFVEDTSVDEARAGLAAFLPTFATPIGAGAEVAVMYAESPDMIEGTRQASLRRLKQLMQEADAADPNRVVRRTIGGMLNNGIEEGLKIDDDEKWYSEMFKLAAQSLPQSALYLIPYAGVPLGSTAMFASSAQRNLETETLDYWNTHGELPRGADNIAGIVRAYGDATIATGVEVLPGQGVGFPATRLLTRLTKGAGLTGGIARRVARLGENKLGAFAIDVTAGIVDEAVIEPAVGGVLTLGFDRLAKTAGIPEYNMRTAQEAFEELRTIWSDPAQFGSIALVTAILAGGNAPSTIKASKLLREQSELLAANGMSEAGIAEVRLSSDPVARAREVYLRETDEDFDAVLRRMSEARKEDKDLGMYLERTGRKGEQEFDKALSATWDVLVAKGLVPKVESKVDGDGKVVYNITETVKGEGGEVTTKEYTLDEGEADTYLLTRVSEANQVLRGAQQADVWGMQKAELKKLYGEAVAQEIFKKGSAKGIYLREIEDIENISPEELAEARQSELGLTKEWLERNGKKLLDTPLLKAAEAFEQRVATEGETDATYGTRLFRTKGGRSSQTSRSSVAGQLLTYVRGQTTVSDFVEDVFEAGVEIQLDNRAKEFEKAGKMSPAKAKAAAIKELAASTRPVINAMAFVSNNSTLKNLAKNESWDDENIHMTLLESLSQIAKSEYLGKDSGILPRRWENAVSAAENALDYTSEMKEYAEAYKKVQESGYADVTPIEDILQSQGVFIQTVFDEAQITQDVIDAYKQARINPAYVSNALVSEGVSPIIEAAEDADASEAAIVAKEELDEATKVEADSSDVEAWAEKQNEAHEEQEQMTGVESNVPSSVKTLFVNGQAAYNNVDDAYAGLVRIDELPEVNVDTDSVQVGQLGNEQVVIWKRKNGAVEVLGGEASINAARKNGVKAIHATVYIDEKGGKNNAKWAKRKRMEIALRNGVADEKVAFDYMKETGLTELEMVELGLARKDTRAARGARIYTRAKKNLKRLFMDGGVSAVDADAICNITKDMKEEGKAAFIQDMCCELLNQGKDWDYINAFIGVQIGENGGVPTKATAKSKEKTAKKAKGIVSRIKSAVTGMLRARREGNAEEAAQKEQEVAALQNIADNPDLAKEDIDSKATFAILSASQRKEAVQTQVAMVALQNRFAERVLADWERMQRNLDRIGAEGVSVGAGAKMYAEILSLVSATRIVLPPNRAQLASLNLGLEWLAVYAEMVQKGELPTVTGVLESAKRQKMLDRLNARQARMERWGWSEERIQQTWADYGARKFSKNFERVVNNVRKALDKRAKEIAMENITKVIKSATPKQEPGHRSHMGKMTTSKYEQLFNIQKLLAMSVDNYDARVEELQNKLNSLGTAEEDFEQKERELQEELAMLTTYGSFSRMSAAEALNAYQNLAFFVAEGKHEWNEILDERKRHREYLKKMASENMKLEPTQDRVQKAKDKTPSSGLKVFGKAFKENVYGLMNFSHLMQAGQKKFGSEFVNMQRTAFLHAYEGKRAAIDHRNDSIAKAIANIFGVKSTAQITDVLNKLHKKEKTDNVRVFYTKKQTIKINREEALRQLELSEEELAEEKRVAAEEAAKTKTSPKYILEERDRDAIAKAVENGKSKDIIIKANRWDGKPAESLNVSKLNVANNLLILEQQGYEHLVEDWNIVRRDSAGKELDPNSPEWINYDREATLAPLYEYVGEDGMALAYWMRDYIRDNISPATNAEYNKRMGIPLMLREKYWPGRFNISAMKEKDMLFDPAGNSMSPSFSFLLQRVAKHHADADWNLDALQVFFQCTEDELNYVHIGNMTQGIRDLLMDNDFANRIIVNTSIEYFRALRGNLQNLDNAVALDTMNMQSMVQLFSRGLSRLASDALNYNPSVYVKQSSGILNSLTSGEVPRDVIERSGVVTDFEYTKIGVLEWLGSMFTAGRYVKASDVERRQFWKTRRPIKAAIRKIESSARQGVKQQKYAGEISEAGGDLLSRVDLYFNKRGALALADANYKYLKSISDKHQLNLTHEELVNRSLDAVGRAMDVGAQPITSEQKAGALAGKSGGISGLLLKTTVMFKSEILKDVAQWASAWMAGAPLRATAYYFMRGSFNYGVAAFLSWLFFGDDEEQEDELWWEASKFLIGSSLSDLSALPIIGDIPRNIVAMVKDERPLQNSMPLVSDLWKAGKSAYKLATEGGDMEWEELSRHCKNLMRGTVVFTSPFSFNPGKLGTFSDYLLDASVLMNPVMKATNLYEAQFD